MQRGKTDSRWAAFSDGELSELYLSLEHRLVEAENGNAYVWWDYVRDMLRELCAERPELCGIPEDPAESIAVDFERRFAALAGRD